MLTLSALSLCILGILASTLLYRAIYNIYIHPLRKFPGPALCCTSTLFRQVLWAAGYLDHYLLTLHARYGPVVRYGPDALSFTGGNAWRDIYGYGVRNPRTQLPKLASRGASEVPGIMEASDMDHTRLRKTLGRAFSANNVRASQGIVDRHIRRLVETLGGASKASREVDLAHLLAETSFRINEEWGFGSVGAQACLSDAPATVFQFLAAIPKSRLVEAWPRIGSFLAPFLQPSHWHNTRPRVGKYTKKLVKRRLKQLEAGKTQEQRFDFVRALVPSEDVSNADVREMSRTATQCVVAGSETTSAALAGAMYWLLQPNSRHALRRLHTELAQHYGKTSDIEWGPQLNGMPWLHACICESMRLYPPSPSAFARTTQTGTATTIDGHEIPPETIAGVHQYVAYRSPASFALADEYWPERWLEPLSDSRFANDDRGAFQPFSFGPRDCAGKQMAWSVLKVIIARVVYGFEFEMCMTDKELGQWPRQRIFQVWETKALPCRVTRRDKQRGRESVDEAMAST